jgi:hypothetical protein
MISATTSSASAAMGHLLLSSAEVALFLGRMFLDIGDEGGIREARLADISVDPGGASLEPLVLKFLRPPHEVSVAAEGPSVARRSDYLIGSTQVSVDRCLHRSKVEALELAVDVSGALLSGGARMDHDAKNCAEPFLDTRVSR